MRKSVVAVLIVVFVAAVVLISFVGLNYDIYNQTVLVETININNDEVELVPPTPPSTAPPQKYIRINYDYTDPETHQYMIRWEVLPLNAQNKGVDIFVNPTYVSNGSVEYDKRGYFKFNKTGTYQVRLSSLDAGDAEDNVIFMVLDD